MNDHDGLCPECHGMGWYATPHRYRQDEAWEEVYCRSCNGTGTLTATPTEEEEEGEYNPWEADEYERWLDSL